MILHRVVFAFGMVGLFLGGSQTGLAKALPPDGKVEFDYTFQWTEPDGVQHIERWQEDEFGRLVEENSYDPSNPQHTARYENFVKQGVLIDEEPNEDGTIHLWLRASKWGGGSGFLIEEPDGSKVLLGLSDMTILDAYRVSATFSLSHRPKGNYVEGKGERILPVDAQTKIRKIADMRRAPVQLELKMPSRTYLVVVDLASISVFNNDVDIPQVARIPENEKR